MLLRARSGVAAALLALAALLGASCGHCQSFNLGNDRVQITDLDGLWRFHTGDDADGKLGWADPAFDDSRWPLLRSNQPWNGQGYTDLSGMAWYRFGVTLPAKHPPLALYVPPIETSYQVFADGRLIGQWGGLPPREKVMMRPGVGQSIPIPADLESSGGPLIIAIRVWTRPSFVMSGGGPHGTARIGDPELLNEWRILQLRDAFWSVDAQNVLLLGYLLAGFAGLGLFLLRPGEREYVWFAATEFIGAAWCVFEIYPAFYPVRYQTYYALAGLLWAAHAICVPTFYVSLLKERRGWLYWIAVVSLLGCALVFLPGDLGWISLKTWLAYVTLLWVPFGVCAILLIYLAARRGNLDARLLLCPVALSYGVNIASYALTTVFNLGYAGVKSYQQTFDRLLTWPFPISVQEIADFLMQISILAILVLRFARTRRDEERQASELEAARVVQQVLLPNDIPAIPGFSIESVYLPAGQVGGDFFQILPLKGGGVLVVIGDVSGKGMPAAMTVSLLVGTVRTLAHYTHSPGEILAAMNQRMLARSNHGFTTCLAIRAEMDGKLTVANAGHIPPYLAGIELALESGLPLGLSAETTYAESIFQLGPNQQLTMLTDGVVEARDKCGALYGFERTAALSIQTPEAIACAAQAFGQDDDITVLSLSYAGVPVSA